MAILENLNFDNLALRALPVDPIKENYTRQVPGAIFSLVEPGRVKNPSVVAYSAEALKLLDIDDAECKRGDFAQYFSGNVVLPGARPAVSPIFDYHAFRFYLHDVTKISWQIWQLTDIVREINGRADTPLNNPMTYLACLSFYYRRIAIVVINLDISLDNSETEPLCKNEHVKGDSLDDFLLCFDFSFL